VSELRRGFGEVGAKFNQLLSFLPNLLPATPSFVSGLITAAVSAFAGELGGALGQRAGGADEGPSQPRPTTAPVLKRREGGRVSGPGTGTSDSILARLSNGEFVIREWAVRMVGPEVLDIINRFGRVPTIDAPAFALGGPVGFTLSDIEPPQPGEVGATTLHQTVNFNGVKDLGAFKQSEQAIKRDLARAAQDGIRRAKSRPR
jgi:hypothetical protein